jgi:hypothetical protein
MMRTVAARDCGYPDSEPSEYVFCDSRRRICDARRRRRDAFDVFVDWHVIAPFYFSFDPQQQR